jgi:hypothetical protein
VAASLVGTTGIAVRVSTALFSALVCVYLVAAVWALPAVDRFKSARGFADTMNTIAGPDDPVMSYRFWQWRSEYAFYSDRRIPNLETREDLEAYWALDGKRYLVVEQHHLEDARRVLGEEELVLARQVGGKTAYLFRKRGPENKNDVAPEIQ